MIIESRSEHLTRLYWDITYTGLNDPYILYATVHLHTKRLLVSHIFKQFKSSQ